MGENFKMRKALLKMSLILMIFSFSIVNFTEFSNLANEEHPEINSVGNTIQLANEEHPEINSMRNSVSSLSRTI